MLNFFAEISSNSVLNDPEGDGDLKFRSKKVIWAPRVKRHQEGKNHDQSGDQPSSSSGNSPGGGGGGSSSFEPPSLIDACLSVIQRNLPLVDHVGQVPYDLFSRVLQTASVEDLARIEKYNPVSLPFLPLSSFLAWN